MKKNNQLIIAIVAVIMIIAVVAGSTFAYWTWVSNDAQKTAVGFTVNASVSDVMYANLTGNGTTGTNKISLKPALCNNSSYAIVKTVPIKWKNAQTNNATVTAILSLTSLTFRDANYKPTTGASGTLASLKWAIRESAASGVSASAPNACSTGAVASGDFGSISGLTIPTSGTSASGLPKELGRVTFTATANTTTEQTKTYYLYIWLDANYTHENQGSVNSDPMQGIQFTTQWSGNME